ncbi:MAG TPA: hypothetical protein VMT58_06215 [Candidatus Binataceae bacterium]|nr:hypothetical protein [Candidatus Binataceae bacterium]
MAHQRIKGSFIYLANAVTDMRGNWSVLAVAIAPMVLAAALCLLPDALNVQSHLAGAFSPGVRQIQLDSPRAGSSLMPPDRHHARILQGHPDSTIVGAADDDSGGDETPPPSSPLEPYPGWFTTMLHYLLILPTVLVTLVTLCALERIQAGKRAAGSVREALAVYRRALRLSPAFLWVSLLQLIVPVLAIVLFQLLDAYSALVLVLALGAIIYLWVYFAQYALVFRGLHSFHALLFSRDLMRKRFFKVSTRLVVFLAVWSGYNSWAAGTFILVSILARPLGIATGTLAATVFLVDFAGIAVSFATTAFFVVAGFRLYLDLLPVAAPAATPDAPIAR